MIYHFTYKKQEKQQHAPQQLQIAKSQTEEEKPLFIDFMAPGHSSRKYKADPDLYVNF